MKFVTINPTTEQTIGEYEIMSYCTIDEITNYAAGLQSNVTTKEVFDLFTNRINDVKQIINNAIIGS